MPSLPERPPTHAACSVCGVTYIEGYEGPCTEILPSATESQIRSGNPPMCPGKVSLSETLARAHYEGQLELARLQEKNRRLLVLLKTLADSFETKEDTQDPLQDASDDALLDEVDALLTARGMDR